MSFSHCTVLSLLVLPVASSFVISAIAAASVASPCTLFFISSCVRAESRVIRSPNYRIYG